MSFTARQTVTYLGVDTVLHEIGGSDEGHRLTVNGTSGTVVPINQIATATGVAGTYKAAALELQRKILPADELRSPEGMVWISQRLTSV